MTTRTPARRASTPAYYLGRPAALWLAALTPAPATESSADQARCSLPGTHEVRTRVPR